MFPENCSRSRYKTLSGDCFELVPKDPPGVVTKNWEGLCLLHDFELTAEHASGVATN